MEEPLPVGTDASAAGSTRHAAGSHFAVWVPLLVIGLMGIASLVGTMLLLRATNKEPAPAPRDLAQEAREDLERRNFRPLSGPLEHLLADTKYRPIPTQTHPMLLSSAPEFA
jgi:hypothetical protein